MKNKDRHDLMERSSCIILCIIVTNEKLYIALKRRSIDEPRAMTVYYPKGVTFNLPM